LSNAIRHFDKALLDTKLLSEQFDAPQELQLAAVLVNVLLEFLRGESRGPLPRSVQSLT
jgi:ubiquitin carboxyl-terminal hydrolase 34